jgi:hypothetical protein
MLDAMKKYIKTYLIGKQQYLGFVQLDTFGIYKVRFLGKEVVYNFFFDIVGIL